jgi:3-oxoacyl-[acyl-carrier-protein] synthase II
MDRKEGRKLDPFAQYAMVVADEAIADANLPLTELNPDRVGVIWGSGIGGLFTFQEEVKSFAKGDGTPTLQSILYSKNDCRPKCRPHFY